MKVTSRHLDEVMVIECSGRLDLAGGTDALREMLQSVRSDGPRKVILNLKGVTSIDTSGLGELASAHARAQNDGPKLKLVGLSRRALELFRITGLHKIFDIYNDEPDAICSWNEIPISGNARMKDRANRKVA